MLISLPVPSVPSNSSTERFTGTSSASVTSDLKFRFIYEPVDFIGSALINPTIIFPSVFVFISVIAPANASPASAVSSFSFAASYVIVNIPFVTPDSVSAVKLIRAFPLLSVPAYESINLAFLSVFKR